MKRSADFLLKRSPNAVEPFIVDWRAEGAVTPVMCQKKVGTCWACAAVSVSAVESKQFLTYVWLIKFHGICSAEYYPYVAKSQSCELGKKSIVWIKGYVYVPIEAMEIIKAVSKQPLFACLIPEVACHPGYYRYGGGLYYGGDKNVPIDANH
ncbi:ervatamin-B-like [Papaver somniferum]|uniref:ervatamin-B-like n=1 Tax=Papaver somniferum TaxID=3469 RepID=UPI000E704B2D|nr:ervatamin-B-like [Papaver somniferum]